MYTWGYIKENALAKLNLSEEEANEQGFLSNFPYYANEAMTQICSAIKPNRTYHTVTVTEPNTIITMPDDFISFGDEIIGYDGMYECDISPAKHYGYNKVLCKEPGTYTIQYNARWFLFTKDLDNKTIIQAPLDVCEAIPSYIVSQCFKIDDEAKAAVYRNEYEMFLARISDDTPNDCYTIEVGGGW